MLMRRNFSRWMQIPPWRKTRAWTGPTTGCSPRFVGIHKVSSDVHRLFILKKVPELPDKEQAFLINLATVWTHMSLHE